ncbi:MinD/ParA family protein [Gordonia sp. HY285]|nr:MinD/ParA family protein [Gordonia liuliyuniae]MCF8609886.1 MinD/ParA family protein [Gordonia liuliyuniae]
MTTDIATPGGTGPYDADTPPWLVGPPLVGPQLVGPRPGQVDDADDAPVGEVDLSGIVPPPTPAVPPRPPLAQHGVGPQQAAAPTPVYRPAPQPVPPQPSPSQSSPPQSAPRQPAQPPPLRQRPVQPRPSGQRSGPALDEVGLIRKARRPPVRGWRRAVHTLSGGAVNPGESSAELEYRDLLDHVRQPVRGDYRIAVLSLKGGVGKTTTTIGLGSTFASLRGDRVIAVDANPDLGTLAQRVPLQTQSTVRDLLADPVVARYSDVRAHTSQAPSRLEVLASERDPAAAEAFDEDEYRGVMSILQRFYNIILTDCGTGMSHSAMRGVLDLADAIVLVSSPALDGARSAGATLDWLGGHGFGHLIARSVVVLSSARPGASSIDVDDLTRHFLTRCRAVHEISFDDHLAEGADIDLELLGKRTRRAFVELAATIADDFGGTVLRRHPPFEG